MPHRRNIPTPRVAAAALALLALTAAGPAGAANRGPDGSLGARHVSIMGAWAGADEKSFRAVLDEFETASPGTTATLSLIHI